MDLNYLNQIDKQYSDIIHKLELGILDYLIFIPGVAFGVWGVPIFVIWFYYYYKTNLDEILDEIFG